MLIDMFKIITHNKFRWISSILMVCILTVSCFGFLGNSTLVEAKTIAQLEQDAKKLEQQQKDINNKLNNAAKKIKDEKEKQSLISQQIKSVEQQIVVYQQKINIVSDNITKKEQEIAKKLKDIDENEDMFAQRVRAMYISNTSTSTLSTLLSAKSFSQFLNNTEILKRISQSDKDLITDLDNQHKELEAAKAQLLKQKSDLKSTKSSFDKKNKSLDSMYSQSTSAQAAEQKRQKEYYLLVQKTKAQIKQVERELDAAIAASKNDGKGPQGKLAWPVPSSSRITSPYGWRFIFGERDFHTGVDIGASSGTSIVAAESGEVILVKKSNYGYGWHIAINHGGGYTTLYAHASRIDVSVGQNVKRGQVIGGVGSTGASTGNHLHFEVRIDGAQKDPMGYIKKP